MTDKRYTRVQDMDVKGKRVFVRVDFNVPLKKLDPPQDGAEYEVSDPKRIEGALDTIRWIQEHGGRCILASHLGRPKGKPESKYSLEPVGRELAKLLKQEVILTDSPIGHSAKGLSLQLRSSQILLLENLRFHPGEEANAVDLAMALQQLCDVYVSDAFGSLHRAHASTDALPRLFRHNERAIGLLVQKELEYLEPLRQSPSQPFMLVMGGSKVSDKIGVLQSLMPKVNEVFVGGAMAYAFLKARGISVGKSLCAANEVILAEQILKSAAARGVGVHLPVDHVITTAFGNTDDARTIEKADIPEGWMGVDVGPKTIEAFSTVLSKAETVLWNGPLGVFEEPAFAKGTFALAKVIGALKAKKLAGGGDSAAAISESGCESQFDFVSTGGGATLEFLEGKTLPGLKALERNVREASGELDQ